MDSSRLALHFLGETFEHGNAKFLRSRALEYAKRILSFDDAIFGSFTDEFFAAPPEHLKVYLTNPEYRKELMRSFWVSRKQGGAYIGTDVYSRREREISPFFNEVLRGTGIRDQIVAMVHFGGMVSGVIHINRREGTFKPRDLEKLMPLLQVFGAAHAALEPCIPNVHRGLRGISLTPREREVTELVAEGKINLDIATILGTSVHTVRRQVESVLAKCGVTSRVTIAMLVAQGLLTPRRLPKLPPEIPQELLVNVWEDMQNSIPNRLI